MWQSGIQILLILPVILVAALVIAYLIYYINSRRIDGGKGDSRTLWLQ
jgi:hypothetical protein